MIWLALVVAVVLVGLTVAAILGRVDGSLGEPTDSLSYQPLPSAPLTSQDVQMIRLDTGLRGYRMAQVDEVIDRLAAEIDDLRAQLHPEPDPDVDPEGDPATDISVTEPIA